MTKPYPIGHMSVFQSIITNTHKVPFSIYANPCALNHTRVRNDLDKLGHRLWFVAFDRPDGYLWYRHKGAASFQTNKKDKIKLTSELKKRFNDTFGLSIS